MRIKSIFATDSFDFLGHMNCPLESLWKKLRRINANWNVSFGMVMKHCNSINMSAISNILHLFNWTVLKFYSHRNLIKISNKNFSSSYNIFNFFYFFLRKLILALKMTWKSGAALCNIFLHFKYFYEVSFWSLYRYL